MSSKVKRKVTVENPKDSGDQPRRPSVFERLGSGAAVNVVTTQPQDRHNRAEQNEKCRNWLRSGSCGFGNTCRYQHDPYPSSTRRLAKTEKNMEEKDLRHKVKTKRVDNKESRTGSVSPKRKSSKRSSSRSRKGEHESKIKSTVVVTRPRSPPAPPTHSESTDSKKKPDGSWEDDSDDWPMDAAQLDYKEELTLERKRQQLQRELELELQKERLMNESVNITKTISFSESSSTSSSSGSGSRSSSSGSSSSSSEDDSDDSSSSSTSSSSSGSHATAKRRNKKTQPTKKESASLKTSDLKQKESYGKIKSSRASKSGARARSPSPPQESKSGKKSRDRRNLATPSPKRHGPQDTRTASGGKSSAKVKVRGPRTPSPIHPSRRQRPWGQSSSNDSRSDLHRNRGKRHKRKRDIPRNEKFKSGHVPTPPPLSSPNRTALLPIMPTKKSKQRREDGEKSRRRGRASSPLLLSHIAGTSNAQPPRLIGYPHNFQADPPDKSGVKRPQSSDRVKSHSRKDSGDLPPRSKQNESRDRTSKRRSSPRKDHKESVSPHRDRFESDNLLGGPRKAYIPASHVEKENKVDRRRSPISPPRNVADVRDRRKVTNDHEKRRDAREPSPRDFPPHRDNQYRGNEGHAYDKRGNEPKVKRIMSPEAKKLRDDRSRDRNQKDRILDYDATGAWNDDHRKPSNVPVGRQTLEPHGRQEIRSQPQNISHNERSRERDQDRKKRKDRDVSVRSIEEPERTRLPSPRRSQSPVTSHHSAREIESLTGNRGRMYESDIPPGEREYAYGYDSLRDPYMDRLLPPEYEQDVLGGSLLYPPDVYAEPRYRRDGSMKETVPPLMDRYGSRDMLSPRDAIAHRDIIGIAGRNEDYLTDLAMEERLAFDERWSRGRGARDDWDPYAAIPPAPLPPHVAAALNEDRYGMPRRRRASPDWPRGRQDDRDVPGAPVVHRQSGRGPLLPKEARSRSPTAKAPGPNRGTWGERGGRHDTNRNIESRHDDQPKAQDDRKVRNVRKDRPKRKDEPPNEKPPATKEKQGTKRQHSSSPVLKDAKRRKEDVQTPEVATTEKGASTKRNRDEVKTETKTSVISRSQKSTKLEPTSPKSETSHSSRVSTQEKVDSSSKIVSETKGKQEKEDKDKKSRRNNDNKTHADDDFSDWSDDDDELLNRDDFPEPEATNENGKARSRGFENSDKLNTDTTSSNKRKENSRTPKDYLQDLKHKVKERGSQSRTNSKERVHDDAPHSNKDAKSSLESKDMEMQETYILKDETATDVEEYITAESVDYDPISDEELDALIEEPDDLLLKPIVENEKSKIVDALDVNWSTLMDEKKTEFVPGFARRRFKAAHVLSRIGFSQVFAGAKLSEKLISICQEQLKEEQEKGENKVDGSNAQENTFTMEHQVASFHVAISQNKRERMNVFNQVGPFRRALCARRDLQIRKSLCKPVNKWTAPVPVVYSPQYSVVDKDLYKQSLELLKLKKAETHPQAIDVC